MLFGILIFLWWRSRLRQEYLLRIRKRDADELSKQIDFLLSENNRIKKSNDSLSEVVHKDNKLISAMMLAVEDLINNAAEDTVKAAKLHNELKELYSERKDILNNYEESGRCFLSVGYMYIDSMIDYLHKIAQNDLVGFDFLCECDLNEHIEKTLTETDLCVFIAEITTNAIISAKSSENKAVRCCIGADNGFLRLDIYDSGEKFDETVIANFGKKRITTHKKNGGSGIGLTTISELSKKYNASIVIDESVADEIFTKCVSVCLDGESSKLLHKK